MTSTTAVAPVSGQLRVSRSTRSSRWGLVVGIVLVVALADAPYAIAQGTTSTMVNFFILLTLATTWNWLAGYAGLVSVGQQAYIGVGAYSVLLLAKHGVEPFIALGFAALICAAFAVPVSYLVFRLRGGYFAIGTWVVAQVFALVTIRSNSLGGGTGANLSGLNGIDPTLLGALTYWVSLGVAVVTLAGGYLMLRSRVGLALTAVRDDEFAARSVGVRVPRAKRIVYLAAAAGAGAAGAVLIISQLNVEANNVYGVQWSAYMIFVVLIGGIGTLEGPILGTVVFFVLQQTLASYGGWYLIIVGGVAIVMAVWARKGMWGAADRFGIHLFPVGYRAIPPIHVPPRTGEKGAL
jgi:branched-chain amino acid transport system permease protein